MAQIQAFMAFGALALRVWQALLAPARMLLPACRLLCLGFALLASTCAWAQTPVDLSVTDSGTLRLDKANVRYLEDGNGQLVIDDITALDASVWQVVEQDTVSFGYSQSAYWLSFKVSNTSAELFQGVVAVAAPLLDEVSLYNVSAGQVAAEYHVGNELPFAQRPYPHRHFIFPVTLPAQSEKQLYLRVRSKSSLQIPITLAAETQYFLNDQNEFMIKSMYYGMMLIMALYNFFLFLATREKAYLYYVGFVSAFALLQATMHGMLYQFLYPGSVWLSQVSTTFLIPATAFFALLFPMRFLRMKRISGRLYFVCKVGVALSCVLMVVSLFFRTYASYFVSMVLVLVTCFVIMTSAFVAMYKGQKSARYFIIAWAMLLVGTTVIALTKFGFLPRNLFTENGLTFGSAIEAVLLSFALADRLNQERLARSRAQNDKLREMSEREKIENELIYQMTHHSVSGLPNAVMLKRSMEALFQQASSYSNVVALVLIKLRNYNDINKTLGHANGDIAIETFSRRLSSICAEQGNRISIEEREGDRIFTASLEKNLFAFLLAVDSEDNINEQVDDMVARLSQPLELKDLPLDVNVSAGISLYPEYATDSTTLLRQAHAAIDSGDRSVSHLIVTYSPDIDARNQRKMMLMSELRGAIESTSLSMHYQPKVSLSDGQILGVEALARWHHPTLGDIAPSEFVPVAEQGGIAPKLTDWVVREALTECAALHREGHCLSVAINVSVINLLQNNFSASLLELCEQVGLAPEYVTVEVTETSIMKNADYALEMLNRLVAAGFHVSIDDFGTGYASLSYIQRLPAHEIKIDKSFVSDMDSIHHNAVIVRTALEMCHNLGYVATAEGVETQAVFDELQAMGCDNVQGFIVAEPMAADDLRVWLSQRESAQPLRRINPKSA